MIGLKCILQQDNDPKLTVNVTKNCPERTRSAGNDSMAPTESWSVSVPSRTDAVLSSLLFIHCILQKPITLASSPFGVTSLTFKGETSQCQSASQKHSLQPRKHHLQWPAISEQYQSDVLKNYWQEIQSSITHKVMHHSNGCSCWILRRERRWQVSISVAVF